MIVTKELVFQYKGNRTYVHGTDIVNKTLQFLEEESFIPSTFNISFKRLITTNLKLSVIRAIDYSIDMFDKDHIVASSDFKSKDESYKIVYEETAHPVKGSYQYDEESIVKETVLNFEKKKGVFANKSTYSIIEIIVAVNKRLLSELNPSETGKWYFGKLELDKPILSHDYSKIEIVLMKNIGVRFTKSAINIDDQIVGYIYFSMN